jgi:hypothetical protein
MYRNIIKECYYNKINIIRHIIAHIIKCNIDLNKGK